MDTILLGRIMRVFIIILLFGMVPYVTASSETVAQDNVGVITTYPVKPMAGGTITFSLSGTYPSDTIFSWTFGDGNSQESSIPRIQYQYQKTGQFVVSVAANSTIVTSKILDLTLQKGDILVHAGEGSISAIIPGVWSHAGMYVGNDTILESTKEGVHISNISVWSLPLDTCVAVFRLSNPTNQTKEQIVQWALQKDHLSYDLPSILLYQKQPDCNSSWSPFCNMYYCSELVWAAYYRNGIDLDPIFGAVLPRTVVTGKHQTTELVGAHIEKIPDAFKHYQIYYDQILQGNNPPYHEGTSGEDTNYQLMILGSPESLATLSEMGPPSDSPLEHSQSPEIIELHLADPQERTLSKKNNTIPNASIENVDLDGDGVFSDELAGIFNPVPGEYLLNITVSNHSSGTKPISLDIGAWDKDQYEWVHPHNEIPIRLVDLPVHFRIDKEDFTRTIAVPNRGPAPLNVSFIELSLLENGSNTWDFGDGTTASDVMNITHLYTVPGTYTIRLVSWDNVTVSEISIPIEVEEGPSLLIADFRADQVKGTPPLSVQFSDLSTGEPVSWNWTFGDGSISHDQCPVHTYSGIGRYSVTLEVTNMNGGQSVIRKQQYITPDGGRVTGPNGMIWITSSPEKARVYVDEDLIGLTPLQSSGIPAGKHLIRVIKDGYQDWSGDVQVKQGGYTLVPKVVLQEI